VTFLNKIKIYSRFLEILFHFKRSIGKDEKQKIFNSYKDLMRNLSQPEERDLLKKDIELLKKYESFLDYLGIYLDFSKSDKIRIYLDLRNRAYYLVITLKLTPIGLFKLKISDIFPSIDSEQTKNDIKNHLKLIADKNDISQ